MAVENPTAGVTVVVPTLNRGEHLLDTVKDLLAQRYRAFEVMVIDQSQDRPPGLECWMNENPGILKYHRVAFRGLPNARNFGWQHARYSIVVFVDDDIRCPPNFLEMYVQFMSDPSIGVCGGGVDEFTARNLESVGGFDRWLGAPRGGFASNEIREVAHIKGCNFAARREVLLESNGFDERMNVGAALHEETDFMLRAREKGYKVLYAGIIRLRHLAAASGGTRQSNAGDFVYALSHNRSIMIRRHSRWFQWPFGMAYSCRLIAAYMIRARDVNIGLRGIRGMIRGWRAGGYAPLCSQFRLENKQ